MTLELATGRYSTFDAKMGVPVAITVTQPKFPLRYQVEHEIRRLAPSGLLKLDGAEFVRAYRERLDRLGLAALIEKLEAISAQHDGLRIVLLCYEDVHAGELCHRRVFADWFEERTGQRVPELEHPGQQLRLTPAARAAAQIVLDRAAKRLLDEGYQNGPDGRLVPPGQQPAPDEGA